MILSPLKSLTKAPYRINEIFAEHPKVGNVVLGQNQLRVPVGLEVGVIKMAAGINLVFICVEDVSSLCDLALCLCLCARISYVEEEIRSSCRLA